MSVRAHTFDAVAPDEKRFRANLQGEIDSAALYRAMAGAEKNEHLASVSVRLAEVEDRHLAFWEHQLSSIGADPGSRHPSWRARTMSFLAKRYGPRVVLPTVATFEQLDQGDYDDQPETEGTGMRDQERSHARVLRHVTGGSPQGIAGETLARLEGRHRAPGGNALRAGVLGANDGLTSNLALVIGTAAVVIAIAAAAAGLFVIGALISLLTGRGAVFSGTRQLVLVSSRRD
jgi:vacuolar iron transporter family protein